ncbi:DUF6745 domain-containing protein [Gordonia soli]|nr:hypothetical protein [Gordonia soli]
MSGHPVPQVLWVPSPAAGAELIDAERLTSPIGEVSAATDIARAITRSRTSMNAHLPEPVSMMREARLGGLAVMPMTVAEALDVGVSPQVVLCRAVRDSLHTSVFGGVAATIRTLMRPLGGVVAWYGQQEIHHLAVVDAASRAGLATFRDDDLAMAHLQETLAASTGWWWAFDDVCIMSERPTRLLTEAAPGGVHGELRMHCDDAAALEFSDGRSVHVVHGTVVPEWVIVDPTPERISRERNIEVRRTAIERIGWDTYLDQAGLSMVDQADDPGNPGSVLQLYTTPRGWRTNAKILLAVNGSRERDGRRRRYGLQIPGWVPTALDAAGWTYGIAGSDYAQLVRRT